jgi:hypothetical protein
VPRGLEAKKVSQLRNIEIGRCGKLGGVTFWMEDFGHGLFVGLQREGSSGIDGSLGIGMERDANKVVERGGRGKKTEENQPQSQSTPPG